MNLDYKCLCNGMEIVTRAYDQIYAKIGCTIVYTTGPWIVIMYQTQRLEDIYP